MMGPRVILSRVVAICARRRDDVRLDDEIKEHLDSLVDEYVRRGMSQDQARLAARRDFGGVAQVKDRYRDQQGLPMVDALQQDLRYAVRTLRKHAGFTAVAVLTLAMGVGANTVIFSVLEAVLLRPLPFDEADRLVLVLQRDRRTKESTHNASPANFLDWRARNRSFDGLAAFRD
jgi:hypothetical protein